MPLIVNGEVIPDGGNLSINGVCPETVVVNGEVIWECTPVVPPSAITDFSASEGISGKIVITFTPATGLPEPTHNLVKHETGEVVAVDVHDGYEWVTDEQNVLLRVDAVNAGGTTPSNVDLGSAGGRIIETVFYDDVGTHTYTLPAGTRYIDVYAVGGGGGGGGWEEDSSRHATGGNGGNGGEIIDSYNINVEAVASVEVKVGDGGSGGGTNEHGADGGYSGVVGYATASGGAGGLMGKEKSTGGSNDPNTGPGIPGGVGKIRFSGGIVTGENGTDNTHNPGDCPDFNGEGGVGGVTTFPNVSDAFGHAGGGGGGSIGKGGRGGAGGQDADSSYPPGNGDAYGAGGGGGVHWILASGGKGGSGCVKIIAKTGTT